MSSGTFSVKAWATPGIGVLDAGTGLRGEHAVLLAALDAAVTVGKAHADALLPAQDGPDAKRRARLDDLVARIARQEFRPLALDDFGYDRRPVHGAGPFLGSPAVCGR